MQGGLQPLCGSGSWGWAGLGVGWRCHPRGEIGLWAAGLRCGQGGSGLCSYPFKRERGTLVNCVSSQGVLREPFLFPGSQLGSTNWEEMSQQLGWGTQGHGHPPPAATPALLLTEPSPGWIYRQGFPFPVHLSPGFLLLTSYLSQEFAMHEVRATSTHRPPAPRGQRCHKHLHRQGQGGPTLCSSQTPHFCSSQTPHCPAQSAGLGCEPSWEGNPRSAEPLTSLKAKEQQRFLETPRHRGR